MLTLRLWSKLMPLLPVWWSAHSSPWLPFFCLTCWLPWCRIHFNGKPTHCCFCPKKEHRYVVDIEMSAVWFNVLSRQLIIQIINWPVISVCVVRCQDSHMCGQVPGFSCVEITLRPHLLSTRLLLSCSLYIPSYTAFWSLVCVYWTGFMTTSTRILWCNRWAIGTWNGSSRISSINGPCLNCVAQSLRNS